MGSPIKGRVKRKNTSPMKKITFFLDPRTCFNFKHFYRFYPVRISYFGLSVYGFDPHQSPIRFKANVHQAKCVVHGPWSVRTPENLLCHAVANCFVFRVYGY